MIKSQVFYACAMAYSCGEVHKSIRDAATFLVC